MRASTIPPPRANSITFSRNLRVVPLAQYALTAGWMLMEVVGGASQRSRRGGSRPVGQLRMESPRAAQKFDAFAEVLLNDSISGGKTIRLLMGRYRLCLSAQIL